MKRTAMKHADDVIVKDPVAAMHRLEEAVRYVLSVPKAAIVKLAKGRRAKKK
jgi:hypothetical protein